MTLRARGRWQLRLWPRGWAVGLRAGRERSYRWWRFGPLEVRRWERLEVPFA